MLTRLIFLSKNMQGLFKRNAFFPDQIGGDGRQLRAKRADCGMHRFYQNAPVFIDDAGGLIQHANAYFYDFADFSWRGISFPAGGFEVNDNDFAAHG